MSLTLNFELTDRDLAHFQEAAERSRKAVEGKSSDDIIAAAEKLLGDAKNVQTPDFIQTRLLQLDDMIAMLRDAGWNLTDDDHKRVLSALAYFADPADLIPDNVQVLGFLDDAVMIELAARDLKHELEAYDEFCEFRTSEAERRGLDPKTLGRTDWLDARSEELQSRMRRRRDRDFGFGYGRSSGYGGGERESYVRPWRPGVFSVG